MFRRLGSDLERPHARWLVPTFLLVSSWPAVSLALPFGSFAYGVMFVILAVIAIALMAQGLASRVLAFFGRFSYFAYFFHFFVLELWGRYLEQGFELFVADWRFPPSLDYLITFVVAFSFATSVTYLVAPLSRAFFERPIMEWARRLSP